MPSPFPGMDPYLEDPAWWRDFHHRFISYWSEVLADVLPRDYVARIDERIHLVEMDPEIVKALYPDVAVVAKSRKRPRQAVDASTMLLEPVTIPHQALDEVREAYIKVLHRPDDQLVTVLELLSPTNKTGDGYLEYLVKRHALFQARVHLVEVDLLLGGSRLPHGKSLPEGDYFTFVTKGETRGLCDVYAWTKRQRIPAIPVPLKSPDADVAVDLQRVFEKAFESGRYADELRYDKPPRIAIDKKDAAWVKQLTAKKSSNGRSHSS